MKRVLEFPPSVIPEKEEEIMEEKSKALRNMNAADKILAAIRRGAEVEESGEEDIELEEDVLSGERVKIPSDLLEGRSPEKAVKEVKKMWEERYRELFEKEQEVRRKERHSYAEFKKKKRKKR